MNSLNAVPLLLRPLVHREPMADLSWADLPFPRAGAQAAPWPCLWWQHSRQAALTTGYISSTAWSSFFRKGFSFSSEICQENEINVKRKRATKVSLIWMAFSHVKKQPFIAKYLSSLCSASLLMEKPCRLMGKYLWEAWLQMTSWISTLPLLGRVEPTLGFLGAWVHLTWRGQ